MGRKLSSENNVGKADVAISIVQATPKDFDEVYRFGKSTLELKVSATQDFMDKDEFLWAMNNSKGRVFLLAKNGKKVVGFIYANAKDGDHEFKHRYACIVYLAVHPKFRQRGIAQRLYDECLARMKKMDITHVYAWASLEGQGEIINFLGKNGLALGHRYVWMDRKI